MDTNKQSGFGSKKVREQFLWFVIGIMFNIIGSSIAGFLPVPVYLDCIGTILTSVCGGLVPGVLVGFATNIINTFSNPESIYYMFANMITAVITVQVFRNRRWFTPHLIAILIVTLGVVCGSFTAVLVWFIYRQPYPEEAAGLVSTIQKAGLPDIIAYAVGNWGMDIVDKALTVLIVTVLLYILLRIGLFKDKELRENSPLVKVRRFSLQTKLFWFTGLIVALIGVVAISISAMLYYQSSVDDHMILGKAAAKLAGETIEADRVDSWVQNGEAEPDYRTIEHRLQGIRTSYPDLHYLYVYQIKEDGCHVVFDLDTKDVEGGEPGEIIPFDESFGPYIEDLLAGRRIAPIVTDDTFGWLLTAYEPVYDKKGNCVCYAAVDVSMDRIRVITGRFVAKMAALFMAAILLAMIILLGYTAISIVEPINSMADASVLVLDTEEGRKECINRMEDLSITTGDEVEHLYGSLLDNMKDTVSYMESSRKKSEDLEKLQDGLIMVLAEVVESRDACTGDHIRRTEAYVRLIMDEMKAEGRHPDILTDEYIQSVARSAPLHDVGKIKIPDAILNKPGRLTDEEFEVIKTHTLNGVEIIEEAIDVVPDPMYLKEARDLAAYHHEKWNGQGYPYGKAGEDIPLSARIMAVADVFDALVSKRSYKQGFSFEKAMSIIVEGSGTHFDPEVVEVFVACSDKVEGMLEEFRKKEEEEEKEKELIKEEETRKEPKKEEEKQKEPKKEEETQKETT